MNFKDQVIKYIKLIPKGKVASYRQVAAASGKIRGAREVGRILRNLDASKKQIPWWRVVNNLGAISIKGNWTADKELQARLLKKDSVKISKDFTLDIEKYRYGKN